MHPRLRHLLIAAPVPAALLFALLTSERETTASVRERSAVAQEAEAGSESAWTVPVEAAVARPVADAAQQALDRDRAIFEERMRWAFSERLDTLPLGEIVARLGRTFVGTTYTPGTLDPEGPERLVLNLRELDCVTYVENMLAMARLIKARTVDFNAYQAQLVRIRYRGGVLDGYPSRLHYFSDWIHDNAVKGVVRDLTQEFGGAPRAGRIDFMSKHTSSYRQLAVPANLEAMQRIETTINGRTRYYIPQDRIARLEDQIREGDIIAMTTTVKGLDISHTGIAVRINGRVHLMHAPLVGKSVEISELPLAERLKGIATQDGIMVARPIL